MKNRQALINRLEGDVSKLLKSEIEYFMDCEHEEAFDEADAFEEAHDIAEYNNERNLIKECRGILIELGAYTEAPVKTCSGRDTRFLHNGIKYDFDHAGGFTGWLEMELRGQ